MVDIRKVDFLCILGTMWKGSEAHRFGVELKLFFHGINGKGKEDFSGSIEVMISIVCVIEI